jgi:hypothetical protein
MAIDPIKKSARLLESRRYTTDSLPGNFEAFTQVFDLNAGEIYTQQNLIPNLSVPFSESGQNGYYYTSEGTISPTVTGQDVMRYWYRHSLTPFESSGQIWFFLNPPSSSVNTIQTIQNAQQTNFISPKYAAPGIAGANAEVGGYKARLFVGGVAYTDESAYAFDYKTGVLQWSSSAVAPSTGTSVQITVNQYVGKTLADSSTAGFSGSFSGSLQGEADLNHLVVTGSFDHTGSYIQIGDTTLTGNTNRTGTLIQDGNLTLTGSFNHTGSYNLIGNITQTGSLNQSGSINVVGPIISNGINVVDNAIAMAIALG